MGNLSIRILEHMMLFFVTDLIGRPVCQPDMFGLAHTHTHTKAMEDGHMLNS